MRTSVKWRGKLVRASHKPNSVPVCAARGTGGNHLSGMMVIINQILHQGLGLSED
jgi:hypothetical protein